MAGTRDRRGDNGSIRSAPVPRRNDPRFDPRFSQEQLRRLWESIPDCSSLVDLPDLESDDDLDEFCQALTQEQRMRLYRHLHRMGCRI